MDQSFILWSQPKLTEHSTTLRVTTSVKGKSQNGIRILNISIKKENLREFLLRLLSKFFISCYALHTERNWGMTGNRAELPHYSHV